jgi:probable lipoprotein NlpC
MMTCNYSDLIGKPFADLGRGPEAYDCWGLVIEIGRRLGIAVPDYGVHYWDIGGLNDTFRARVPEYDRVTLPECGDIVAFKRVSGELHFGVMVDQRSVLHAGPEIGVRLNRLDNPFMRQMIDGFYRCKT